MVNCLDNSTCTGDDALYRDFVKPGAHRPFSGFLKLISCGRRYVCLCLCVSASQAIKNYSREMKSE